MVLLAPNSVHICRVRRIDGNITLLVEPRDRKGTDDKVAEEPQSLPAGFPFNELIEDCVNLILTDYLDLPTLLSYGYTSKAAISRVKKQSEENISGTVVDSKSSFSTWLGSAIMTS